MSWLFRIVWPFLVKYIKARLAERAVNLALKKSAELIAKRKAKK